LDSMAERSYGLHSTVSTGSEGTGSSLVISGEPLDFLTSVKRGSFKSKCRWVSLHS
jgi:hypothetical protein